MLSRRSKRLIIGFTFLGVVLVVILVSVARFFAALEERRRYEEERASLKPRELFTVNVERRDRERIRRYSAQISPWIDARVGAEVAGRVVETLTDPGYRAHKGETLIRLDPVMARIELQSAEAAVEAARVQAKESERLLKEAQELSKRSVMARTELEAARSRAEASAADLRRLEAEQAQMTERLDRHEIKAPFDGIVRERFVDAGDVVGANEAVFSMVALDPLRVIFAVTESEVGGFKPGETVALEVDGMPGEIFRPVIRNVSRAADPQTRLFTIEAALSNPGQLLPGGTQGVVSATIDSLKDRLFVPTSAVRLAGQRALVEKVNGEGIPELVEIEIGQEIDGTYPVLAGLSEGDRVVVR